MSIGPDQQPWCNVRSSSTTSAPKDAKIKRPRRAREREWPQATPHRLAGRYGPRTPVTMTVTIHTRADMWAEVATDQGRFFVPFDASVFAIVQQIIRGGHRIEPHTAATGLAHRRGVADLAAQQKDPPSTT